MAYWPPPAEGTGGLDKARLYVLVSTLADLSPELSGWARGYVIWCSRFKSGLLLLEDPFI